MHELLFYAPWAGFSGLACYLYLYRQQIEAGKLSADAPKEYRNCAVSIAIDVTLGVFSGLSTVVLLRSLAELSDDVLLIGAIFGGYGNRSFPLIVELWIERFKGRI